MTQLEALDLNAIIAEVRDLLSTSVGAHVDLRIEPAAGLPAIRADRGQVGQILLNLAVNARDAIPQSGTMTIGTGVAEFGDDDARLHPGVSPGRYVELTVSDTGIGMSAEVARRIFEPFFTTKSAGQGTGLGLSTVQAIVTEAGGMVTVESDEGAGTTFRLYFPALDVAVATPDATPGDRPFRPRFLSSMMSPHSWRSPGGSCGRTVTPPCRPGPTSKRCPWRPRVTSSCC